MNHVYMMAWQHPEFLWALSAVPIAVLLFLWAGWQRRKALRRFGDHMLVRRLAPVSPRRRRWKASLVVAGVLLMGLTLAGPQCGTQLREVKREGVDLVVALDVSLSMMAEDVAPNRLVRAKNEIKKLLDGLRGDRVGLVVFAGDAFVQCPLTTDYGAVRLFLDVADPNLLPTPGTDFNAALQAAIRAFEVPAEDGEDDRSRALLIISDGENHVAGVDELVRQAQEAGIVVFAAGVGETKGVPIPVYAQGQRTSYKRDRRGEIVQTRLEEDVLKALSRNGAYFRIASTSSSLPELVSSLERLDRAAFGADVFEEYEPRYQWPLLLALLLLGVEHLVSDRQRRRRQAVPS